jgi:hypothetical protein
MTENEYFDALRDALHPPLLDGRKLVGGHFVIEEVGQAAFALNVTGLTTHEAIKLERMKADWPCFRAAHKFAHRRCDRIVVAWNKAQGTPQFLLVELKSANSGGAHQQLGASLAFCQFLHHMVCVGHAAPPNPAFIAVTVKTMPFAQKLASTPTLPPWTPKGLHPVCKHMHFDRSRGSLPVAAVLAAV